MNDSAIRDFCITARNALREQVARRALLYGIGPEGYVDPAADVVDGRVLTPEEIAQRKELIARYLAGPDESYAERYEALIERAAYTWFNRLVAIRYMEVNDRLPSHVRMLSAVDGSFASQAMAEALHIGIAGIDRARVAELVSAADDETLFRYLFLAQCDELAFCLPDVFEPIGSATELLLPDGLLRRGGVASQLVEDIPERDWEDGVEIVGWMYQYYNAERKDDAFASFKKGKKAEADALAPATQLFTPDWIVRYLVENSLGRLWLQVHPDSALADSMPYYIPDEESVTSGSSISSPEDISVIDPACGSGHILVYAFDLLARIYEEAGYSRREIPQLILGNNLSGIEIDPRAAALASFALAMKGCELDSRFLTRGALPKVTTLVPVALDEGELEALPMLAERAALLDAMAHANECGSLFVPVPEDMLALGRAKADLESRGDLLSAGLLEKVETMIANCEPLAKQYDIVVANPPYMGGKNMNKWLSDWVKKNYPDVKGDLFTCFIVRNLEFANEGGQLGFMTPYVWMFIGTYEKLRLKIMKEATITSLIQLEYSGFAGATVPICTFTLQKGRVEGYRGGYVRLSDFVGAANQAPKALEAIVNPDCGWFYRRDASAFSAIPGSPIAYWISNGVARAYKTGSTFELEAHPKVGMQTSNNSKFLRRWWEVNDDDFGGSSLGLTWIKYLKGGDYRKWYGNLSYLLHFNQDPSYILMQPNARVLDLSFLEKRKCTWTDLTSGEPSFRFAPEDTFYDISGHCFLPSEDKQFFLLGYANTSIVSMMKKVFNSSFHFQVGDLGKIVVPSVSSEIEERVTNLAEESTSISKRDWDSFETSWDFKRHPMV